MKKTIVLIFLLLMLTGCPRKLQAQALRKGWGAAKPPYGTVLNTAHPSARGLIIALTFSDGVAQTDSTNGGSDIRNYGYYPIRISRLWGNAGTAATYLARNGGGKKIIYPANNYRVRLTDDSSTSKSGTSGYGTSNFLPTSGGCTILLGYQKSDTTRRHTTAFGAAYSAPYGMMLLLTVRSNINQTNFSFGGVTETLTRISYTTADADDTYDVWGCSTGPRGMEIWKNGNLVASNSANPSRTQAAGEFAIGAPEGNATDLTNYDFFYLWARQLTPTEIAYLSKFPFDVFTPPPNWLSMASVSAAAGGNFTIFHGGGK